MFPDIGIFCDGCQCVCVSVAMKEDWGDVCSGFAFTIMHEPFGKNGAALHIVWISNIFGVEGVGI